MTTPPKPQRRWFQFRLRTLMVFVTLCAVACSWFAVRWRRAEKQREAVEAIREAGGNVRYEYEFAADGRTIQRTEPPAPAWLVKLLGVDFFFDVVGVTVVFPAAGDDSMKHLRGLTIRSCSTLSYAPL